MTEQITMNIEAEESKLKIPKDKKHILSYLTFLEKFYEKSKDSSHQERLFRINKAINSINKYSNCKVSSFNVKPSKTNLKSDEKKFMIPQKNFEDSNDIENILKIIEKELKQNGINEKDISNSQLSTSIKTINSPKNIETNEKQSSLNVNNGEFPKTSFNQKRLSKLFLKIELKLKTFLQENSGSDELKGDNGKENSNDNQNNDKIQNENISFENNLNKSPSKLPKVIDSFFSNKKKVDSILSKVRKQRRKSVMDFNVNYCNFPKEEKEKIYLQNSEGDENQNKKRKKIIPCSAQVEIRNKIKKNPTSEKISNFCDMIDENEENKEDFEEINAFDTISESNNENNNNNNDESNTINDSININNEYSIKIVSSLNNKNIFNFDCSKVNNTSCKIDDKNNKELESEDNNNYHFVSKNSVFKNEIGNASKVEVEGEKYEYGSRLLDDEILMKSSDIKDLNSIKKDDRDSYISDSVSDSESSNGYNSKDNNSVGDERYNLLKYINDSKSRKERISNNSEEEDEKYFSPFGENSFNKMKIKSSLQRDIIRNNNINGFTMNSILSPIRDMDGKSNTQCIIEEFSKFNP